MGWDAVLLAVWIYGAGALSENAGSDGVNACTNGSLEQLAQQGFAADWGPIGRTVEMSREAHTGQWAVRLVRSQDTPGSIETGLNRTRLIDRTEGGMDFWYKAQSAQSAELRIMVIPIGEDGRESTGSSRSEYLVPVHHVADGQWHHARIRYDYTNNPKVKWVHFAARITGKAGEMLLDDFSYLERTGPILHLRRLRWEEDLHQPGEKAVLSAKLENTGDAPAESVQLVLQAPEGLSLSARIGQSPQEKPLHEKSPLEKALPKSSGQGESFREKSPPEKPLREASLQAPPPMPKPTAQASQKAPDSPAAKEKIRSSAMEQVPWTIPVLKPAESVWVRWTVDGHRTKPGIFVVRAVAGQTEASDRLEIAPQMVLRSFGPTCPVAVVGRAVRVECVVENPGQTMLTGLTGQLRLPAEVKTLAFGPIPPGRCETQAVEFVPNRPTEKLKLALTLRVPVGKESIQGESELMVLPAYQSPAPTGRLHATAGPSWAILENQHLRLVFVRAADGFGPAEVQVRTASQQKASARTASQQVPSVVRSEEGATELMQRKSSDRSSGVGAGAATDWTTVAWLEPLSRLVWQTDSGPRTETIYPEQPPEAELGETGQLVFRWTKTDAQTGRWAFQASFSLGPDDHTVAIQYTLQSEKPQKLLHFQGPMFSVLQRREAIFPGLEWLVNDEVSSSSLDIAEDHPHRLRRVVHPQMITIPAIGLHTGQAGVGLLWDNRPRSDRPGVLFDSPDRLQNRRTHRVGLFLPPVPDYVEVNQEIAHRPYPMVPGKPLEIRCQLYVDGAARDALAALEQWIAQHGLPDPMPLPHGSYEGQIRFSMQAYLQSLWDPQTQQWWTTKGGGMMSKQGRPPAFVADLLLGELLSLDRALAKACRSRAEEVARLIGGPVRLDAQRRPGRFDLAVANPLHAAQVLLSRYPDGTWRFDADYEPKEGPFVGMDYHRLGPHQALEVGTCARKAYEVLRYARIAGDWEVYEQMRPTLETMERFDVPRAAQVWEVPVHTPDLLAAADAVDAFLEAYWISGQKRWLDAAVQWARRGLPFIYLWEDPEKPFLLGASIPVFGATWHTGSWFGRPVQWNGLRYAAALLKLARHDQSHAWRKLATLIIHSAAHQQALEGTDAALWPDNISTIDSKRCPWVFAPRQIIECICELLDRPEEPRTVMVGQGDRRFHLTAPGQISQALWDQKELRFTVAYPAGEEGVVLISPIGRPEEVHVDGQPVPERQDLEQSEEPGWRYDPSYAYLSVRVVRSGPVNVRVRPAEVCRLSRVPRLVPQIAFEFNDFPEGWLPVHQVENLHVADGALQGMMTGPDPYLIRPLVRAAGNDAPVLRLRLRVSGGRSAQLFWTTEVSPHFDEHKSIRFSLQADGQFHEYRLPVGQHPAWSGQTITSVRLDLADQPGEFALDYLRGESE